MMRYRPTALGWINHEISIAPAWDRAQVQRLARYLGYELTWADIESALPVADQVRQLDVDAVIVPAPEHLGILGLNAVMSVADIESVWPRMTFSRWDEIRAGRPG